MEAQCRVATTDCVVLDIPLLVESPHWRDRVHTVWVVDCTADTQRQRVMRRNGWSAAQVEAVMQTQATRAQRLAVADVVIDNDQATLEQLETRVRIAFQETRQRFGL
jgi:dephospho-CoA kinase